MMEPLLFSDHLRELRRPRPDARPGRAARLVISGTGATAALACVVCFIMLTLGAALSRPAEIMLATVTLEEGR